MILRVRDKDGNVLEIPAIKGDTPKNGVDYFTEDDKRAFANEVLNSIPAIEMVATLDDGSTVTYQIYGGAVTE